MAKSQQLKITRMKKLFLISILFTFLASCSTTKSTVAFTKFLTDHHFQETHVLDPTTGTTKITASIDSLYDYSKVAEICDTADITFQVSRGKIKVQADCSGAGSTLVDIFKNLISKIKLNK